MVDGVVQGRQLVVGAKVSRLTGVREQRFLVDVVRTQQSLRFYVVLYKRRKSGFVKLISNSKTKIFIKFRPDYHVSLQAIVNDPV